MLRQGPIPLRARLQSLAFPTAGTGSHFSTAQLFLLTVFACFVALLVRGFSTSVGLENMYLRVLLGLQGVTSNALAATLLCR